MDIKHLFLLPLLLFIYSSNAQTNWAFQDSTHRFSISLDSIFDKELSNQYELCVKQIVINKLGDNKPQQIIVPSPFHFDHFIDSTTIFILEDMNFDGFNDFRLLRYTSTNLQVQYWYWLYNPSTKQFEKEEALEPLFNPHFDQTHKVIHAHWRIGIYEQGHAIYTWQNDKLFLSAKQVESMGIEGDITQEYFNGKIETVKAIEQFSTTHHTYRQCYFYKNSCR